jgi:hypothetical protein
VGLHLPKQDEKRLFTLNSSSLPALCWCPGIESGTLEVWEIFWNSLLVDFMSTPLPYSFTWPCFLLSLYFFFCFVILLYNIIIVSNFGYVPYLVYFLTSRCTTRLIRGIILLHIFLCLSFVILKWPQDISSYLPACTVDAGTSLATNMHKIALCNLHTHTHTIYNYRYWNSLGVLCVTVKHLRAC